MAAGGRRRVLAAAVVAAASAACRHTPPRSVANLAEEMRRAREACVVDYAPEAAHRAEEAIARAEATGQTWHRLRAREQGREASDLIRAASAEAAARQAEARERAVAAIEQTLAVISESARLGDEKPDSGDAWRRELNRSQTLLDEARRWLDFHPCEYERAEAIARDADVAARQSLLESAAFRSELADEERRNLEEAARRRDAARRRAAESEERRKREVIGEVPPLSRWGVSQGDCLWRIAADPRVYGDPFRWPLLWRANRLQIGDPDLILPGQSFLVPRDATPAEIAAAVKEARNRVWPTPNYLFDGR